MKKREAGRNMQNLHRWPKRHPCRGPPAIGVYCETPPSWPICEHPQRPSEARRRRHRSLYALDGLVGFGRSRSEDPDRAMDLFEDALFLVRDGEESHAGIFNEAVCYEGGPEIARYCARLVEFSLRRIV